MRYGIVSDVHGNLEALTAVFAHLHGQRIDRYAFLGDAVGYGADANAVCDLLRRQIAIGVLGNHDAATVGRMDLEHYYAAARHALEYCQKVLSEENVRWLKNLPYTHREGGLGFCHGSPLNPQAFDYLTQEPQVESALEQGMQLEGVTFIGHSHLTVSFEITGPSAVRLPKGPIHCDPSRKYIITVGSVGQPRDRDPRSCCGIFDTETRLFEYHRVDYDFATTGQKIRAAGLAMVFGDRLGVGM